jgi:tetratricopeptide (TPR) repeat protein
MKKRVLFSMALMLIAGMTYAQEKNVKEAKSIANGASPKTADFEKAESLMNEALVNPETKDNPETWNIAGLVQKRWNEEERKKPILKQAFDTLKFYNTSLDMCKYYLKCDELAQIPNEKGKIKNKYRKPNTEAIKAELGGNGGLYGGGVYAYNDRKDPQLALKFFGGYIDISTDPMLESLNLVQTDTILPLMAYYASLAAMQVKDYKAVLKYAPYAQKDKENAQDATIYISTALKELGDTAQWINSLKEGMKKYPSNTFFSGSLIDYYINKNKSEEAMRFTDELLANDPQNTFYLYVKGLLYRNEYSNFKNENNADAAEEALNNAAKYYKQTVDLDPDNKQIPDNAVVYSELGLVYSLQAQDFSEKATSDINNPKYATDQATMKNFYEEAKNAYEKARELSPDNKDLWLNGLHRVYYNLNMGEQFEEMDKMLTGGAN